MSDAAPLPRETVQDYPRPPALEPVAQEVRVVFAGQEIVCSTGALRVLETHHAPSYYIPPKDVADVLVPARGSSVCEWKGRAAYWDVTAGGRVATRAAWSYPEPAARFAALRDYLAFYAGQMDTCYVGGVRVLPQPGEFYGGWVTPNLDGIVKGGPGTLGW